MSSYLGTDPLPPAALVIAATEERQRRRAATQAALKAGQISAEKATWDDVIWSNIVHFMRRLGGDRREPQRWHPDDQAMMARNVRATIDRMIAAHDAGKPGMTRARIEAMRHCWYALEFIMLYCKVHPIPAEQGSAITRAAQVLKAHHDESSGLWSAPGKAQMTVGQMLWLAAHEPKPNQVAA